MRWRFVNAHPIRSISSAALSKSSSRPGEAGSEGGIGAIDSRITGAELEAGEEMTSTGRAAAGAGSWTGARGEGERAGGDT